MAEDAKKQRNDRTYMEVIDEVLRQFSSIPSEQLGSALLEVDASTSSEALINFSKALNRLPDPQKHLIISIILATAPRNSLSLALVNVERVVASYIPIVTAALTPDAIVAMRKWWKGEISAERCAATVINSTVFIVATVLGTVAGGGIGLFVDRGKNTLLFSSLLPIFLHLHITNYSLILQ